MVTANLLSRLQGLTAPDREVGREVLLAFGWRKTCVGHFYGPLYHWSPPGGGTGFRDDDFYRHDPTASLDAAIALAERMLPDALWDVGKGGVAKLLPNIFSSRIEVVAAATPAIALCIALLRALEARDAG